MAELKLGNKTIFSESSGTLTAHNLPKQMVINAHVIQNGSKSSISQGAHGTVMSDTYTKKLDDTHLYLHASIWGVGHHSGVCGTCFYWYPGNASYTSRSGSDIIYRSVACHYCYHGQWTVPNMDLLGIARVKNLSAGLCTIGIGWATNNNNTGSKPFNELNANSSNENRNQQCESHITIYEVVV
tara:strand:+ start:377 stop:928 length:552 start_codon:yes stop_codon:yes gene_type:complete